jgi:hypothetical protein
MGFKGQGTEGADSGPPVGVQGGGSRGTTSPCYPIKLKTFLMNKIEKQ